MRKKSPSRQRARLTVLLLLALGPGAALCSAEGPAACGEWTAVDNGRSGPFSGLTGVAALSARDVWAIGGLFALHWDGTEWSKRALPDLDQGLGWRLDTVGAVAPSDVWFGGLVAISPFYSDVLMVRWNGSEWDRTDAIHLREQEVWPFNPRNGAPDAVLALSADDVWAVGVADGFSPATTTVGLAVHWDGSEWTEVDVPAVTDDTHWLTGVDGVATDDVWAVGWGRDIVGTHRALTYHWDGSAWSHVSNPAEGLASTFLEAVVAVASDDVWAAGRQGNDALFLHWDGDSWSIVGAAIGEGVYGLGAFAGDDLWAVGWPDGGYYHGDGSVWSPVASPTIAGASSINRTGGLTTADGCEAWSVGGYFVDGVNHALTERWVSCACSSAIFADGFEAGDSSEWSQVSGP